MNEDDYAKTRHGYEARDLIEVALDFALVALALAALTFVLLSAAGFIWGTS